MKVDCRNFEELPAMLTAAELAGAAGERRYREGAERLLTALSEKRLDLSPDTDFLLTHCSVSYHDREHNHPLIYADYFFTEAVLKRLGKGAFMW